MALWFDEHFEDKVRFGVRVTKTLFQGQSQYQRVDVVDTVAFGRCLLLDSVFQTSVGDEYHYHEMLVHPALTTAPQIKRVLIIGGGDGGTAREVLSYPEVEQVVLVELDEMVVRACQEHLSEFNVPWGDPRLDVRFEDGVAFLQQPELEPFDVIFVDGPDPVGPAAGLFESPFYRSCKEKLSAEGVLATQSEAPDVMTADFLRIVRSMRSVFPRAEPYFAPVPIYPCGSWSFTLASDTVDRKAFIEARMRHAEGRTRYYNRQIHESAFALPQALGRALQADAERA